MFYIITYEVMAFSRKWFRTRIPDIYFFPCGNDGSMGILQTEQLWRCLLLSYRIFLSNLVIDSPLVP